MDDIIREIGRRRQRGERMALASLVWSSGSIPMSDRAKMIVGDETIDVRDGDAVYGPPGIPHGLTNDSDDWVEHLIISADVA